MQRNGILLAAVGLALAAVSGPAWAAEGDAGGGIILSIVVALYFAPTFVAMGRGHSQTLPIGLLNLFLGWTVLGWVVALVWAFIRGQERASPLIVAATAPSPGGGLGERRACPHCAEPILVAAKVCRFCGRDVEAIAAESPPPGDAYTG